MAKQGLAALVGGFQEGYEFVDERRREKQVRELLGRENIRLENQAKGVEHISEGDFDFASFTQPETYGQKLLGGIKNLFRPQQQAVPMQALQAPPASGYEQRTAEPAVYKHGGSVRHMVKKYANGGRSLGPHQGGPGGNRVAFQPYRHGGKAIAEDEEGEGEGLVEIAKGVWLSAKDVASKAMPRTRRTYGQASRDIESERKDISTDLSAAQMGRQGREYLWEGIKGTAATGAAAVADVAAPLSKAGEFVGGVLGYGTGGEDEGRVDAGDAIRALPVDEPPEQVTERIAAQPGDANITGGGGQSRQAVPSTQQAVPSTQGRGEQEVDFSTEAREVMPEDLAAHSSKDWEKERRYWAAHALTQGQDPFAAMDKVSMQQQNGFTRYAMQSTALMDAGDMEGAARALYAAYQYFPNGKDVKFGIQKGKDGQRVIIAMGRDEESGEPSGPPQILNRDTVTRMVENLKKPGALRAWTTDWQATEAKLWEQGYKRDVLKETGRHNRATEMAATARTEAIAAGGGMKQADWDRSFAAFRDDRALQTLEDPEVANDLADVMTRLYQKVGGGREGAGNPSIIKAVMAAYSDGTLDQLREKYGLQPQAVQ